MILIIIIIFIILLVAGGTTYYYYTIPLIDKALEILGKPGKYTIIDKDTNTERVIDAKNGLMRIIKDKIYIENEKGDTIILNIHKKYDTYLDTFTNSNGILIEFESLDEFNIVLMDGMRRIPAQFKVSGFESLKTA